MQPTTHSRVTAGGIADGRTVGDLIRELRDEGVCLFRQEVALARTEFSEKAQKVGRNVAYLAAGGLVAFAGFLFLLGAATAAVWLALSAADLEVHAIWLAPLIVGGLVAAIGYVLIQKAITTLKHESPVPQQTVETLQENKQWIASKVKT